MIRIARIPHVSVSLVAGCLLTVPWAGGCSKAAPDPVGIPNTRLGPLTVAVAPALNFSGSTDFDRNTVADLMASELSSVADVEVIPVSRVLAVLAQEGREEIASPAHAWDVVNRLGADAILVFAVTEYEPYNPPIMGIAAQLYGVRGYGEAGGLDPVRLSREARPPTTKAVRAGSDDGGFGAGTFGPLAQSERVFDASHEFVEKDVREFARQRDAGDSPFGWELYLVSQKHYARYCCYRTVQKLFGGRVALAMAE